MYGLAERPRIVTAKKTTTIQLGRSLQHIQRAPDGTDENSIATAEMLKAEYERGRDEARRELANSYAALNGLVAGVKRESTEMLSAIDRFSTVLALRIATKIIDREIENPAILQQMVASALAQVPSHEKLVIRLNPADRVMLEKLRNENSGGHTLLPADAVLMADPDVRRGGCMIESNIGTLDARLDTQLRLIEQALLTTDRKAEIRDAQQRTDIGPKA